MVDTGSSVEGPEPLTRTVLDYGEAVKRLVAATKDSGSTDWGPLAEFVAVDEFGRVGTFLEVQDWQQYTEMMTQYAARTASFETTVRRITETSNLVYFEIEERHFRGDNVHVVNSLTVFEFDEDGKIRHMDVYLQQPR